MQKLSNQMQKVDLCFCQIVAGNKSIFALKKIKGQWKIDKIKGLALENYMLAIIPTSLSILRPVPQKPIFSTKSNEWCNVIFSVSVHILASLTEPLASLLYMYFH